MRKDELICQLNGKTKSERLDALRGLYELHLVGEIDMPITGNNVNNHIHTTYSFSPYSPTKAVYMSWISGLATAGVMDHDSMAGSMEFIDAAEIINFPVTVGVECRCSLMGTPFDGRRVNNPDQKSVAYMAIHGVPHQMIDKVDSFFAPYREKRNLRNRRVVDRINDKIRAYGFSIDFDKDILPLSKYHEGGSVTERHIMYGLSAAIAEKEMQRQFLLGLFKSYLMESVYVEADEELPKLAEFISLAERVGGIPTYPYLGDVGVAVTGDKKTQTFEDSFLEELLEFLISVGVKAVTYMPARNSDDQLDRIIKLCEKYDLFQICGEDINSPLQEFICEKIETPRCRHLIDSAWALIGHERASGDDISKGMFTSDTLSLFSDLQERIRYFAQLAKKHYTAQK